MPQKYYNSIYRVTRTAVVNANRSSNTPFKSYYLNFSRNSPIFLCWVEEKLQKNIKLEKSFSPKPDRDLVSIFLSPLSGMNPIRIQL